MQSLQLKLSSKPLQRVMIAISLYLLWPKIQVSVLVKKKWWLFKPKLRKLLKINKAQEAAVVPTWEQYSRVLAVEEMQELLFLED